MAGKSGDLERFQCIQKRTKDSLLHILLVLNERGTLRVRGVGVVNSKVGNRHSLVLFNQLRELPSATYAWARHEPTLPAALNYCL